MSVSHNKHTDEHGAPSARGHLGQVIDAGICACVCVCWQMDGGVGPRL